MTFVKPRDTTGGSCGAAALKCGTQQPYLALEVTLSGIEEAALLENYALYISDGLALNTTRLLGSSFVAVGTSRVQTQINTGELSPAASQLCVDIASVSWSGAPGERVSMGCREW